MVCHRIPSLRGHIPVDGDWDIRYRYDPQTLTVNSGEFENAREPGVS